jgi:hypothetical protein
VGRRMAQGNGLTMIVEIMTHKTPEIINLEVTPTSGHSSSHEEVVVWVVVADLTAMGTVEEPEQVSRRT